MALTDNPGPVVRWALLCSAWLASRAWLLAAGTFALPFYPGGPLAFADLDVYAAWVPSISAGVLPTDQMWQYPPFSAFFFAFGALGDSRTVLQVIIVAVDLLLTVVLYRHSPRAGWSWVGAGLIIGPVLIARFDVVPSLLAVLAVLAAGRPLAVGAWSAAGAALKVWPVFVLAVVPRRDALRSGAAFAAVTAALLAVTALTFTELSGFLGGQGSRGLQVEAAGALGFMVANAAGVPIETEYRFGAMEVASSGAGVVAVLVTVGLVAVFAWLGRCWWRGTLAGHEPADVAFTLVLVSVVFSRVFSPQYSVWLLALGALCLAAPGSRMRGPVLLVAISAVCAQILYPWGYGEFLGGHWGFVSVQVVRIGLVITAAVVAVARISRPAPEPQSAPDHVASESPVVVEHPR